MKCYILDDGHNVFVNLKNRIVILLSIMLPLSNLQVSAAAMEQQPLTASHRTDYSKQEIRCLGTTLSTYAY